MKPSSTNLARRTGFILCTIYRPRLRKQTKQTRTRCASAHPKSKMNSRYKQRVTVVYIQTANCKRLSNVNKLCADHFYEEMKKAHNELGTTLRLDRQLDMFRSAQGFMPCQSLQKAFLEYDHLVPRRRYGSRYHDEEYRSSEDEAPEGQGILLVTKVPVELTVLCAQSSEGSPTLV